MSTNPLVNSVTFSAHDFWVGVIPTVAATLRSPKSAWQLCFRGRASKKGAAEGAPRLGCATHVGTVGGTRLCGSSQRKEHYLEAVPLPPFMTNSFGVVFANRRMHLCAFSAMVNFSRSGLNAIVCMQRVQTDSITRPTGTRCTGYSRKCLNGVRIKSPFGAPRNNG